MAKLGYTDIKPGVMIEIEGIPYEVLESRISKKSRQKAFNQTRIKNLLNGNVIDRPFRASEFFDECSIEKQSFVFIYRKGEEFWFHTEDDKGKRFSVEGSRVTGSEYIKQDEKVTGIVYKDQIIRIYPNIKVHLKVVSAPPSIKGNTSQGGSKRVELETGAIVNTPMFIKTGDVVCVNTQKGEYIERVSSA